MDSEKSMWPNIKRHIVYMLSAIGLVSLFLAFAGFLWLRQAMQGDSSGQGLLLKGKSPAKMFLPSQVASKFSDVAGAQEAKQELADVIEFLKDPEKFKSMGAKAPHGILLIGEPGNGKTLLAKAVAGEANCPFFSVSGSEFVEMYVGLGASRVRELFEEARKINGPCIIFIDEVDAIARHRGRGIGSGNDEREQTLNQLLTELDGFEEKQAPIIVIAATNIPDVLDKAFIRPGRFDRKVTVPYPDLPSREEILRVHTKKVKVDPSINWHKIARGTTGFTGADLANLINEAAISAVQANKDQVVIGDLEEARDKIIMGKAMRSKVLSARELEVTAYHEAGHALIRLMMPQDSEPLYKVTIVPRGSSLGATHWLPERDKYLTSKNEMVASIISALGGRVAEDVVFNVVSTGASSDFKAATDIARSMVCAYGMNDDLGPVTYDAENGKAIYSEATSAKIDTAVRELMKDCYRKAKEIIVSNRGRLNKLAEALLEKETLSSSEVYELLELSPRTDFCLN